LSPDLATALRTETPAAPEKLRNRVSVIAASPPPPRRRFTLPLRNLVVVGAAAAAAASLLAAVAVGVKSGATTPQPQPSAVDFGSRDTTRSPAPNAEAQTLEKVAPQRARTGAAVPAGKRAQDVNTSITLLVDDTNDLSGTTQRALRITRNLGGYVQRVDFGSQAAEGTAALQVRIPVSRVQAAVVRFSDLGRILAQQTQITDLQQRLDELTRQIRRSDDPSRRAALRRERIELNRRAAYATLSLDLTTHEPEQKAAPPSRIDRAVDDATGVLAAELAVIAYAVIVASPFLVLLAAGYAGRRAYRRYSDLRLLERA
jgi:Domain of unknown function (DUF4349)